MSIDCTIQIETTLLPEEILKFAAQAHNAEIKQWSGGFSYSIDGISPSAHRERSETGKKMMLNYYGFTHNMVVSFQLYSSEDPTRKRENLKKGIISILGNVEGNAVVLWMNERTILERLNGKTLIEAKPDWNWLAEAYDEAGLKYERKPLRSPFW